MAGIHQITETSSITIVDTWEPKEEGLDTVETKRRVSVISITLSKEALDTDHIGYQPPLPEDQVCVCVRGRGREGVLCCVVWCMHVEKEGLDLEARLVAD